jgi:hypothetical protein
MATTTNYSWTTPDDSALVKDGASAIRSLGTAIDSTVFTNAGAAVTKATVDAKGDLIAGTADNTIARLAVGANDTVLTADSSTATGLKWAAAAGGGMTLLSTTTLSGASTTISGISQSYNSLMVLMYGVTAAGNGLMKLEPNSASTQTYVNVSNDAAVVTTSARRFVPIEFGATGWNGSSSDNACTIIFNNYTSTTNYKPFHSYGYATNSSSSERSSWNIAGGVHDNTAISSLKFSQAGGNLSAGTVLLYGVK